MKLGIQWQDFFDGELLAIVEADESRPLYADGARGVLGHLARTLAGAGIVVDLYGESLAPRTTWCWEPAHERVPASHDCDTCCEHPAHEDRHHIRGDVSGVPPRPGASSLEDGT